MNNKDISIKEALKHIRKSGLKDLPDGMEKSKDSKPYKCPVCGGTGLVPTGFYHVTSGTDEKCRACGGKGIVWDK